MTKVKKTDKNNRARNAIHLTPGCLPIMSIQYHLILVEEI